MHDATLTEPRPTTAVSRPTRWLLVYFYLLCVIWGLRCIWHTQESPLDFYLPISLWIIAGWWVVTDARQRKHPGLTAGHTDLEANALPDQGS